MHIHTHIHTHTHTHTYPPGGWGWGCPVRSLKKWVFITPGLHNKIPAQKISARGWVAQEPICS